MPLCNDNCYIMFVDKSYSYRIMLIYSTARPSFRLPDKFFVSYHAQRHDTL